MELNSICLILTSLSVSPDTSQFWKYDKVTLSCEERQGNVTAGWSILRNTTERHRVPCESGWGSPEREGSACVIEHAYPADSAVYWCESSSGACSKTVNITVTNGEVILDSPLYPLEVRESLTLRCRAKDMKTKETFTNFNASFYKDGSLIRTESTGVMTIPAVSKSDEGPYKCQHPTRGESLSSFVAVKVPLGEERTLSPFVMSRFRVLCSVLVVCPYILTTIILVAYCRQRRARAKQEGL